MSCLLLIDSGETSSSPLRSFCENRGFTFLTAATGGEGLRTGLRELPDLVFLDSDLTDTDSMSVLREMKAANPETVVIIISRKGDIRQAVEAVKFGAEDYFEKPLDMENISLIIERALDVQTLRREAQKQKKSSLPIIGRSRHIQGLIHIVNLMAENESTTVLIEGETGTGKELIARNIHELSRRSGKPFVDINCASIPESIFESELCGHEAGAFTDARTSKKGLFELAEGGTLFLDEVAEMPLPLQPKLLRVIETKTFRRVGGTGDIRIDVRIIAATNKNLSNSVSNGSFREDLYYRLNVIPVKIPPLRERPEDIPLLAEFFLRDFAESMNKKTKSLANAALHALCMYSWPGNIRELRNVLERAMILCQDNVITLPYLALPTMLTEKETVPLSLREMERIHIKNALESTGNNRSRAAQILGISRSTLNEKIKAYQLN